ncbi:MAG TPA: biopolymer transporter ExbD [Alphaproteobacteria bacterium]|nr:biopolymer transporter ExbD [Alphaproteobacteria bacterium]
MARKERHVGAEEAEMDMTPMLDIVFIMLIFFIVTSSFVKESGIDIHHPTALTAEQKPQANVFIGIAENDKIWMQKKQVDPRTLRATIERVMSETPGGSIVIQADKGSNTQTLLEVMNAAKAAGVGEVAVAAQKP